MPLLETTTAEGALKGMILGRAPHELNDQEAAYLQDILVSQPGFLDRRGAIQGATSLGNNFLNNSAVGCRPCAIGACYDPSGNYRILVMYWNWSGGYYPSGAVFDSGFNFLGGISFAIAGPGPAFPTTGYGNASGPILLTPSIDGGLLISASIDYSSGPTAHDNFVAHWWGGYSSALSVGAGGYTANVTLTTTDETTAVTGSAAEIAKLKPGIVIFGQGIVKSIDSATTASLTGPARGAEFGITGSGTAVTHAIRAADGVWPVRTRGRINCAVGTASATDVTGFGTRFLEMWYPDWTPGVPNLTHWVIREPQSGQIIARRTAGGTLSDLSSDTRAFLGTVSKAVALAPFQMYSSLYGPYLGPTATSLLGLASNNKGFITWSYSGYQFYANSVEIAGAPSVATGASKAPGRVWIGGPTVHNEMDHSRDDGNWFDIPPGPSGSDQKVYAGLNNVICTANASYALLGSSPDDFHIEKIADDGCISATAITSWNGNTIWLGKTGIWAFDGSNPPVNLVKDSMALEWAKRLAAFQTEDNTTKDAGSYPINRAYCFVYRDHLFVNIQNTGSTHTVYTDGVARTSNPMQLMIYLPNNALSFLTNFNFVGFLTNVPGAQQEGYAVLVQDSSTTHYAYPMSNFFKQGVATTDAILTANGTLAGASSVGPWVHIESRKFDAGDGIWRKTWKQLAIEQNMTSTKQSFLETVPGLNTTGTRTTLPYIGTGVWKALKLKFNARDQYMSFRIYEDIANRPATFRLGAWQWGFKFSRRGQV